MSTQDLTRISSTVAHPLPFSAAAAAAAAFCAAVFFLLFFFEGIVVLEDLDGQEDDGKRTS